MAGVESPGRWTPERAGSGELGGGVAGTDGRRGRDVAGRAVAGSYAGQGTRAGAGCRRVRQGRTERGGGARGRAGAGGTPAWSCRREGAGGEAAWGGAEHGRAAGREEVGASPQAVGNGAVFAREGDGDDELGGDGMQAGEDGVVVVAT
nr:PE-PGRS family protein PE_PGRS33-like [Aegilops tauschii subsp. strangulata]